MLKTMEPNLVSIGDSRIREDSKGFQAEGESALARSKGYMRPGKLATKDLTRKPFLHCSRLGRTFVDSAVCSSGAKERQLRIDAHLAGRSVAFEPDSEGGMVDCNNQGNVSL